MYENKQAQISSIPTNGPESQIRSRYPGRKRLRRSGIMAILAVSGHGQDVRGTSHSDIAAAANDPSSQRLARALGVGTAQSFRLLTADSYFSKMKVHPGMFMKIKDDKNQVPSVRCQVPKRTVQNPGPGVRADQRSADAHPDRCLHHTGSCLAKAVIAALVLLSLGAGIPAARGGQTADNLARNFLTPPDSARPWAYWVWLNGNVTKVGITKDMEEMRRQGMSGVLVFQAGDSKTPAGAQFFSPEWRELFQHTLREAARLGMVVSIDLCDGWDAGGPWITQDQANKKLVYSELQVDGAKNLDRLLPLPEIVDDYYHDVAVLAIREKATRPVTPDVVTASSTLTGYVGEWNFYPQDAVDGDPTTYWSSRNTALSVSDPLWLAFDYEDPLAASALYVQPGPASGPRECELQSSEDGTTFTPVTHFILEKGQSKRIDFATVRSRHFRLAMTSSYGTPVQVAEAVLLRRGDEPVLRRGVKWWWFKSGNRSFWDYPRQGPSALEEEYADDGAVDCRSTEVVDLTTSMDADGRIKWEAPPGRWTVLRSNTCISTVTNWEPMSAASSPRGRERFARNSKNGADTTCCPTCPPWHAASSIAAT